MHSIYEFWSQVIFTSSPCRYVLQSLFQALREPEVAQLNLEVLEVRGSLGEHEKNVRWFQVSVHVLSLAIMHVSNCIGHLVEQS